MLAKPINIEWRPDLPIFAKESFLKAAGDEYGWLGGFSETGELRCILPYTIIQKAFLRMVRFRVETIAISTNFDIAEEKAFLNCAIGYFKTISADMVIPATTNTIFRTFPDGAEVAPYGTHVINLEQPEEVLWKNIDRITRQNIKSAQKAGVKVREVPRGEIPAAHTLIRETFRRSRLPFMDLRSFQAFLAGLGENGRVLAADLAGDAQSFCVLAHSDYRVYAIYAGNILGQTSGANKLLYWEAMLLYKGLRVRAFDFVGARIHPEKGSKQEALTSFKSRFGATLKQGYMWKYSIRPLKFRCYQVAVRLRSGGDIVDAERHKLDLPDTSNQ